MRLSVLRGSEALWLMTLQTLTRFFSQIILTPEILSKDIAGDVSPEGLCMISASESADGNAYLLASCEVSGTVAAYKLISQNIDSSDDDNTDNNHDNNIDHNGSGHGGADTEDLNNQESKTNALKTGDHAPVIGTGIGMVLALSESL